MLNLIQRSRGPLGVALVSFLLPSAVYAQAAITGVVETHRAPCYQAQPSKPPVPH